MSFERQDRTAVYALTVLTFINLFNYVDRWVVAAVVESIKHSELHLTDTELGLVGTGFIFVYTLTSPFFGRAVAAQSPRRLAILGPREILTTSQAGLVGFSVVDAANHASHQKAAPRIFAPIVAAA